MVESAAEELCAFANGGLSSRSLKKDHLLGALKNLGWQGDFESIWCDLVHQCKRGLKRDDLIVQQTTELQYEEIISFYTSNSYALGHQIESSLEVSELISKILSEFDKDGDGRIAGNELQTMTDILSSRIGSSLSTADILNHFDAEDAGGICPEHLSLFIFGPHASATATRLLSRQPTAAHLVSTNVNWEPTMCSDELIFDIPPG